jgi:hypothetical protein
MLTFLKKKYSAYKVGLIARHERFRIWPFLTLCDFPICLLVNYAILFNSLFFIDDKHFCFFMKNTAFFFSLSINAFTLQPLLSSHEVPLVC